MADVNHTLTTLQDVNYILNNEPTAIGFTLSEIDPCTADKTILVGTIEPGVNYKLPIKVDGRYSVKLELLDTESTIIINHYVKLQLSTIESIFSVTCDCGCGCADCTDLNLDIYKALLATRNKIDTLKYLSSPKYDSFFQKVHKGISCLIEPQIYCDITTESVTGVSQYNSQLTKDLISLDYLIMYFADLRDVSDLDEIAYINDKYQSESILCCINSSGVNIKEIQDIVNSTTTTTLCPVCPEYTTTACPTTTTTTTEEVTTTEDPVTTTTTEDPVTTTTSTSTTTTTSTTTSTTTTTTAAPDDCELVGTADEV